MRAHCKKCGKPIGIYAGNEAKGKNSKTPNFPFGDAFCGVRPDRHNETQGVKFDTDKLRTDLLPIEAIEDITQVFTFGAKKYGDRNWEKGMKWTRLIGASLRHLFAVAKGEDIDKESGLPHLSHLGSCVLMLLTYRRTHKELDDRVKTIDDKKEKKPSHYFDIRCPCDFVNRLEGSIHGHTYGKCEALDCDIPWELKQFFIDKNNITKADIHFSNGDTYVWKWEHL